MIQSRIVKKNIYALVIDDEPQVRSFIAKVLKSGGWQVREATTADEAFQLLNAQDWLLVFCDVMLGGVDGYAVLRRFVEHQSSARFVLMTGRESGVGALDATAYGAYDYLTKPFTVDDILNIADSVYEQHKLRLELSKPKSAANLLDYISDLHLIGKSPKFVECLKMVGRIAPTNLPVLITGESGTGKEVIARAIHQRSNRAAGAFVAVNCGAIPTELIDSELFGHARGSFTGADRERVGLWEAADGGTLFLDEITETTPLFQVKLLRALQEREIRRVGSNQSKKVDVRVIAATNRNIEAEVEENRFRSDLMYRLNTASIHLPSLNERLEDIPLLVEHFSRQINAEITSTIKFSDEAMEILRNFRWQGNIRELENTVVYAVSLCSGTVYPEHLPPRVLNFVSEESPRSESVGKTLNSEEEQWVTLDEIKARYAEKVLAHTKGNKQAAIKILGIDRKTLVGIVKRNQSLPPHD